MGKRGGAIVVSTGALRRAVAGLMLIVLFALVVFFARPYLQRSSVGDRIDHGSYQAVFLTGGQVFFGHALISGDEDGAIALSDVYYLTPNADTSQSQQLGSLVKRGTELHGPREPMIIQVRQVLFIENMRDDSQVVQAIKRFKSGEQPSAPVPQVPTATSAPAVTGTARPSASR